MSNEEKRLRGSATHENFSAIVTRAHTRDVTTAVDRLGRLYGEVTPRQIGEFDWSAEVISLGPMMLIQGTNHGACALDFTVGRYAVNMTRAGTIRAETRDGVETVNPLESAIIGSPGQTVKLQFSAAVRTLNLVAEPNFIHRQLESLIDAPTRGFLDFQFMLDIRSGVGAYLHQTCHYIAQQVADTNGPLPPVLISSLCESLTRALLTSHPHSYSYLLEKPTQPSSRQVVRRVEEYIDSHAAEPLLPTDLAKVSGTSAASVEAAFQEHRGMSTAAFLRQRRLARARLALLSDAGLSIPEEAHKAGFLSLEVFEAAYYKQFRETPLETKRRGLAGQSVPERSTLPEPAGSRLARLSEREREVCRHVTRGLLNKQIAAEMGLSEKTVQEYRGRALQKLGVKSVAELVRLWEHIER